jgi:hypothetical protein
MPHSMVPHRKHPAARNVDEEMTVILSQMIDGDEPITARALVPRMQTIRQASSLTPPGRALTPIADPDRARMPWLRHVCRIGSQRRLVPGIK